jgi:two-component system response regulator AlgR
MNQQRQEKIRVVIVDDEALARAILREWLASRPDLEIVAECANGFEAVKAAAELSPDLLMLDIQMPKLDGFEVLELLGRTVPVIFTTAYDQYALRAFEVHAVDYLLKPIRLARLKEALARAHPRRPPRPEALRKLQRVPRAFLSVPERGKVHLIPIDEVIYLKAELKYLTIRTPAREYLMEESLTRLEQEYGDRFVRVHRNCLVARSAVRGFERSAPEAGETHWLVLLAGVDEKLAVSRRQQHIVREFGKG